LALVYLSLCWHNYANYLIWWKAGSKEEVIVMLHEGYG